MKRTVPVLLLLGGFLFQANPSHAATVRVVPSSRDHHYSQPEPHGYRHDYRAHRPHRGVARRDYRYARPVVAYVAPRPVYVPVQRPHFHIHLGF